MTNEEFGTYYNEHWQFVLSVIRRVNVKLKSEDVADISQDVWLTVWRRHDTFRGDCDFRGWIGVITRNATLNCLRKKPDLQLVSEHFGGSTAAVGTTRLEIEEALNRVPPAMRRCLTLFLVDGLEGNDIAKLEGITRGGVKTRIMRAKAFAAGV